MMLFFPSLEQTLGLHLSILFFTPTMLQTSDFGRSDRYCHFKCNIHIIIPRLIGGAFSICRYQPQNDTKEHSVTMLTIFFSISKCWWQNLTAFKYWEGILLCRWDLLQRFICPTIKCSVIATAQVWICTNHMLDNLGWDSPMFWNFFP